MTAVEHAYHHWLQADPLMRLRMAPVIPDMARGWPRTENRVVGMLLQAVPKDIYEDLVANRHMSTVSGSSHVQAVHRLPAWRTSGKNFSVANVGGLEGPIR